jgi:hypothetical protein
MESQMKNSVPKISTKRKVWLGQSFSITASVIDSATAMAKRIPAIRVIMVLSSFRQRLRLVNVTLPLLTLLLFALPSFAQNVRWDSQATTTTGVGQLIPVLAIPGASISFYTGCTTLPCTTPAVTFNAATGNTACPSNAQVVWQLPIAAGCKSTADSQGNFGGYFSVGAYQFTETISGHVAGPYQFNVGDAGSSATIGGSTTANEGVGAANANNTLAPVPETEYETVGGVTTYTCQEDHDEGIWDVRCRGWNSNPSTALTNTIQAAMCYYFTMPFAKAPVVHLPAGSFSLGGNISIPPGIDIEGVGGTEFGQLTQLTTTDTTQQMMTQVNSQTFTCGGTTFTASGNGATIGNIELIGGGATAKTDIGLANAAVSDYIHNMTFTHFGGPGRTNISEGINSRGSHILATSNLSWYFQSGAYNTSGFTDTAIHGSLELTDVDSSWDHVEETGFLQDSGYFNRFNLDGVLFAGYRLIDSYIQSNPHDVYVPIIGYSPVISQNRFDNGWWSWVLLTPSNNSVHVTSNTGIGFCTSPTLNPANFPTNPGGITTDSVCSAIESQNLGSIIALNSFSENGAIWPNWPVGDVFAGGNEIGGVPSTIDEPGYVVVGDIGGPNINIGSDVSKSLFDITFLATQGGPNIPLTNTGLGGTNFHHYFLDDSTAQNYTSFVGGVPDTYLTIAVGQNVTITPSSTLFTCDGKPIHGAALPATVVHPFWFTGEQLIEICSSGLTAAPQTTVSCSTSGTAVFAQPFSGPSYSSISIQSVACNGTASYTYPNAFTYTPSAGGALSAIASSISTTAVTVTGTGSSGFLKLEALQ